MFSEVDALERKADEWWAVGRCEASSSTMKRSAGEQKDVVVRRGREENTRGDMCMCMYMHMYMCVLVYDEYEYE